MKILILGNARHGKDTLAELMADRFGMTYKSSSEMAMEIFLFDMLKEKHGYETMQECFEDRVNHRQIWYLSICDYNKDDRARLAKDILEGHDCYVGMRDLDEFKASKELFDVIIWVDASKRLGTSENTNSIGGRHGHNERRHIRRLQREGSPSRKHALRSRDRQKAVQEQQDSLVEIFI